MIRLAALLASVGLTAALQERPGVAADELAALPTERVAAALLPAETAVRIAHHEAIPPPMMAAPPRREGQVARVMLYAVASPNAEGVCRRDAYLVDVERRDGAGLGFEAVRDAIRQTQLRLDADCASAADKPFATLNPGGGVSEVEASRLLARLGRLRADARTRRRLDVTVECSTEYTFYRCPRRTRGLLADLPLEGAYYFGRSYDGRRDLLLAATETTPGSLYWEIRLTDQPESVLHLNRKLPAPF